MICQLAPARLDKSDNKCSYVSPAHTIESGFQDSSPKTAKTGGAAIRDVSTLETSGFGYDARAGVRVKGPASLRMICKALSGSSLHHGHGDAVRTHSLQTLTRIGITNGKRGCSFALASDTSANRLNRLPKKP